MTLTPLQEQVKARALELVKNEPWFKGLCMDNFPEDHEITRDGIEEHAQQIVCDTAFWDDPSL